MISKVIRKTVDYFFLTLVVGGGIVATWIGLTSSR